MKMNELQKFIYFRTYSRWMEGEGRRELAWEETAQRYFDFMMEKFEKKVPHKIWKQMNSHVKELGVVPSMRAVWSAGEALKKNNILGYNCSYVPFIDLRVPSELFYILMCGTGVGFSVENRYVSQMPAVKMFDGGGLGVHVVDDSREGWAVSLEKGIEAWFNGKDIEFDYSKVRPRGSRLKTMGGRASGPEPLRELHAFCREIIQKAQGRKLTSVEWLDIGNKIAEVVVVGGVRRSSEITFSDLNDEAMRHAKEVPFPPHRFMSNNSAVYFEKPSATTFLKEWSALAASGTGERGIYNVGAIKNFAQRREFTDEFRSNPCGEIILRPFEFCNLTEVVVRANDDFDDLIQKVQSAVWLGCMQADMTEFPYIRPDFARNCRDERLLGVSLTGQMDNPKLMTPEKLQILKKYAIKTASRACKALGINVSVAITTGKPSGTVSQLVDAASGAHPRYAPYYIRRVRIAATDPLFRMMRAQGVKFSPENGQRPEDYEKEREKSKQEYIKMGYSDSAAETAAWTAVPSWSEDRVSSWVVSFLVKSPKGAITRHDVGAIEQLEWYLKIQENWCEHNQSITVYVKDDEWLEVGAWVYKNFDRLVGVSFLPYDGGKYEQTPYEEITKEKYEKLLAEFPAIDYSELSKYELEDTTTGAQQYACTAGNCEIP